MARPKKTAPPKDAKSAVLQKWLGHITAYDNAFSKWERRVQKILERYRDEDRGQSDGQYQVKFNILWSNVQTLVPATYSRLPKPDVSRRFLDSDPVGRVAGMILERALDYEVTHYADYRATMRASVYDRFLGGRGTAWVRYEPHVLAVPQALPTDGVQVTEDVDEPQEELDYECAPTDYVHWRDFGHTVARSWEEVTAVWRWVYMGKEALVERFGEEKAKTIPLDATPEEMKRHGADSSQDSDIEFHRAKICELWDKTTKKAYWFSKSRNEILDERADPLGLEEFFPCPPPLYSTMTNDSLIPVPDFTLYQDQARELDILADRIDGLVKALKVTGVYNAAEPVLARLFTEGKNTDLLPVKNWMAFAEKQGLRGSLDIVDLDPIGRALKEAYLAMQQIEGQVYQITGISDIVRGQSNPNETLGAQKLKAQFVGMRLRTMQEEVALYATHMLRLKAQVICGKFAPQTILLMSGAKEFLPADQQLVPQALELLLGPRMQNPDAQTPNPLRSFRIEIAADSLVQYDEQAIQESRVEFLKMVGGYLEKAAQVAPAAPEMVPLIMSMLKFGVQGFKVARSIESEFDRTAELLKQRAGQPKADPEQMRAQIEQEVQQRLMAQNAEKEIAHNRKAADLDIRELKFAAEQQVAAQQKTMDEQIARFRDQMAQEKLNSKEQSAVGNVERMIADLEAKRQEFDAFTTETDLKLTAKKSELKADEDGAAEKESERRDMMAKMVQAIVDSQAEVVKAMQEVSKVVGASKRVVRDPSTGRAVGVETVQT